MTLSTTQTKVSYIPDGTQSVFAVPFPFFGKDDLCCKTVDSFGKEWDIAAFSVEGEGSEAGARVRFSHPPAAGRTLVIHRNTRRVQESDYPEGGKFPAVVVEQDFDRLTGMIQEIDEGLGRAVKVPITSGKSPEEAADELLQASWEAEYWGQMLKDAAAQAAGIAGASLVTASGGNTPRPLKERFADVVNVKDYGAVGDGLNDDSAAILAACETGKSVYLPAGRYRVSRLIYLTAYGQKLFGAGVRQTTIFNDTNDEPLFLPGKPNDQYQVAEFGAIEDLALEGNPNGATLWGIFIPCAPWISLDGPHPSAVSEGWAPLNSTNFYYKRLSFPLAGWYVPARGFCIRNVRVQYVYGGYGVHASAWGWSFDDLQIYDGLRGIRISGAANSCNTKNLYISHMQKEGIICPNAASSQPTNLMLINSVVQDCGAYDGGNASVALLKGTSIVVDGLYTENNNLKGATRDVFVGVNAINTHLDNLYTTVGNDGPYPDWCSVETQGAGTVVGTIFQRDVVGSVLTISGSDTRTATILDSSRFHCMRGAPTKYVDNAYTGTGIESLVGSFYTDTYFGAHVSLYGDKQGLFAEDGKLVLRNKTSTANDTEIHTYGNLSFCTQVQNAGSSAGRIRFFTNGDTQSGALLMQLLNTTGALLPGADNHAPLGSSTYRWSQLYAANSSISTSDARRKRDVADPDAALFRAWSRVRFKLFRFHEAYAQKGENARLHVGLIAQEIQEAFAAEGLDAARYGLFCFDSWEDAPAETETTRLETAPAVYDEDGNLLREATYEDKAVEIAPARPGGELYGIRYSEALALEAAWQRRRLDDLEARLAALLVQSE
jgi:hypothetical protein